ncbi:MAG TPA: 16S rRNA (cytosine(1402)-N(4))-methyltransferase RsmH [Ghiorsea sp.]|nr:16S rRNA (cytosine(1402)-N(4))-methyltransferase RsmH [Ghiorsea sp.]HIP06400.1 16S rRNA (cytosine(1402)-N(4))-methyltransferase RsmH [Mariprofundaceae bacterium]
MVTRAHISVLAAPYIEALCTDKKGRYIDATFGRGGHTKLMLETLSEQAQVLGLDRDPQAIEAGEALAKADARFSIAYTDFAGIEDAVHHQGWGSVAGIGFDLGVSSPQLDQAERGFSFMQDGPLDMRMDCDSGQPLSAKLAKVSESELVSVIREYGGERFAGRIAKAILDKLNQGEMNTTKDLENACFHATPKKMRHQGAHPATRTFQALRIWVNDEMNQIDEAVKASMKLLQVGGRLAIISFHSGEDRRIRDLIEKQVHGCVCPREFPMCVCGFKPTMKWVQKKPIRASEEEIDANPRSRSAMLRVAEKLAELC